MTRDDSAGGPRIRRAAALLLTGPPADGACPPGIDPAEFARALAEDVLDLLAGLADVRAAIAFSAERKADAAAIRWPGTELVELSGAAGPLAVLIALGERGYDVGAVVAPDVPDLPGLLIAKPFSALSTALVSVLPADDGIAVLASRLPPPPWLPDVGLDSAEELARLRAVAPRRRDLRTTPAWHRLRAPADLARLDPELEGWEATRALLSGAG